RARWAQAHAGCFRGTLCSHRQPERTHFGCSASHSCAYSWPRTRQAGNARLSVGRCSMQEPGAPCKQKTSTSAVMSFSSSTARPIGGLLIRGLAPTNPRAMWRRCPNLTLVALLLLAAAAASAEGNDYPTAARADYVIGCMAANGNTREALLKCSCAIDVIAGLMPYSRYEQAETALGLQAGGGVGGRVGLFRDPPQIKAVIEELHRAQAEANLQCQ